MARGGRSGRNGGGGCARCCLGFLLKFLAFLQAFAAVSAVLYAASILSRWARHHELHFHHLLPDLWFACAVMAAGLLYCAILLAGYVAAEINSGCCLCFYTILAMVMMLLEAAVAGHLLLNEHWIQDLPYDRTRELENLVSFVNNNLDLCKWAALATVATQAFSLFLAMTLRAMVSPTNADYDSDQDFVVIRRPLLLSQGAPAYLPTTADPRGAHPGLWSSSMRQKTTEPRSRRSPEAPTTLSPPTRSSSEALGRRPSPFRSVSLFVLAFLRHSCLTCVCTQILLLPLMLV